MKKPKYKNGKAQGYFALALDQQSAKWLLAHAKFPIKYCQHVTLWWEPDQGMFDALSDAIGHTLSLMVTGLAHNDRIQAAVIEGHPSSNPITHVTISALEGVEPVESNTMFESRHLNEWVRIPISGVVEFIEHKEETEFA